jgi:hypothetical protein
MHGRLRDLSFDAPILAELADTITALENAPG